MYKAITQWPPAKHYSISPEHQVLYDAIDRRHDAEHGGLLLMCNDEICDAYLRTKEAQR